MNIANLRKLRVDARTLAVGGLLAAMVAFLVASGCSIDRWIKIRVPPAMGMLTDLPDRIPLAEADLAWQQWDNQVRAATGSFKAEVERGRQLESWLSTIVSQGLIELQTPVGTLPGGTVLVGLLAGLGGLLLNRPGTARRMDAAKAQARREALEELAAARTTQPP